MPYRTAQTALMRKLRVLCLPTWFRKSVLGLRSRSILFSSFSLSLCFSVFDTAPIYSATGPDRRIVSVPRLLRTHASCSRTNFCPNFRGPCLQAEVKFWRNRIVVGVRKGWQRSNHPRVARGYIVAWKGEKEPSDPVKKLEPECCLAHPIIRIGPRIRKIKLCIILRGGDLLCRSSAFTIAP